MFPRSLFFVVLVITRSMNSKICENISNIYKLLETREVRPWGAFECLAEGVDWHLKILSITPNRRLSYQSHNLREEYMILVDGEATLVIDDEIITMRRGQQYFIPLQAKHRLLSQNGGLVIEISTGTFDESDIVRYEDDHGRV